MTPKSHNNIKSWYKESPCSLMLQDIQNRGIAPKSVDGDLDLLLMESMINRGLLRKCYQVNVKGQVVAQFFDKTEFVEYVSALGENAHADTVEFYMTQIKDI